MDERSKVRVCIIERRGFKTRTEMRGGGGGEGGLGLMLAMREGRDGK